MNNEDFVETYGYSMDRLRELLDSHQFRALKDCMAELNEADAAEFLESLPPEDRLKSFRMLNKDQASEVFAFLDIETQRHIIESITDAELGRIVEDLFVDDAVDMLEELPASVVQRVLKNAKPDTRALINQFLKYPENSAGSIMTAEYLALKKEMSVYEAFDYIRAKGQDSETIYDLFVTDARRCLEGVVSVKDLLMNPYESRVGDIMDDNIIKAITTDDQEDIADLFTRYDLLSMPVVDQENRLVGIITVDDVVDVMEAEATEDIEKMAAILPSDKPYLNTGVWETWKARFPWLLLMMVSATFTGIIIDSFESALAASTVLIGFIPMLMGTGGNSGNQTTVTIIRSLSLNDIAFSDLARVIWKEIRVAVLCGITLAAVNFLKLYLVDYLLFGNTAVTLLVALVINFSLLCTVFCAKLVGCILPIFAEKVGFDPAVMASPFITTIVDTISLIIYFQFARIFLGL